ncbi:MAG: ribosome maturation factor RimP [Gammaproteobacteria bacterium]
MLCDGSEGLRRLLEPVVVGMGYELVGIERSGGRQRGLLRVYIDRIDRDGGITLDDCERVSHQLSGVLDVEDAIRGAYTLEVSSPGLDRPLFAPRDFARFVGQMARIDLDRPIGGRRRFSGVLCEGTAETVRIVEDGEEYCIPFAAIHKARLVPQFATAPRRPRS